MSIRRCEILFFESREVGQDKTWQHGGVRGLSITCGLSITSDLFQFHFSLKVATATRGPHNEVIKYPQA